MDKPDVDFIEGLSPAISIDQKSASRNPRSTVGTITEIYDYLRLLYARIGVPHCPNCGRVITRQTPQQIVDRVLAARRRAPASRCSRRSCAAARASTTGCSRSSPAQGFTRARVDGEVVDLAGQAASVWRATRTTRSRSSSTGSCAAPGIERRLTDSLETALRLAEGVAEVEIVPQRRRGRRARDAHVLRAPRVHALRALVRRARAAQLLVQLALRRVRALRRARHPLRGRPRAASSPTTTSRSTTARSRRGRGSAASTSSGCSTRSATSTASRPTRRGRS